MHSTARQPGHHLRLFSKGITLLLLASALYGCAVPGPPAPRPGSPQPAQTTPSPIPVPQAEPLPAAIIPPSGPAASLYQQADSALRTGNPGRAEILIERALRIDPDQPLYWHMLGRAKYDQAAYEQAVQFFLKAESRMNDHGALAHSNRQFLEAARRKSN